VNEVAMLENMAKAAGIGIEELREEAARFFAAQITPADALVSLSMQLGPHSESPPMLRNPENHATSASATIFWVRL
jgi:hypothetical protein